MSDILINPSNRVVIIGAGNVGSSIAYSILSQEIAKEILIIDVADELVKAQVLDLQDAANFTHGVQVKLGSYDQLLDGDIVAITCGVAQKEGQTRTELLQINAKIIREVINLIKQTGKIVYIVMVTNPVDVLTYIAVKESGLPDGLVFGSGTFLDSGRLRVEISEQLNVSTSNIHAYILGEHGDSSFPVLSSSNVAGIALGKLVKLDEIYRTNMASSIRDKAYEIIKGKKATYYGIGSAVARIIKCILKNEKKIVPLSVMLNGEYGYNNITIGVPAMISSQGVKILGEINLDESEKELFRKSVEIVKSNIEEVSNMVK